MLLLRTKPPDQIFPHFSTANVMWFKMLVEASVTLKSLNIGPAAELKPEFSNNSLY